MNLEILDTDPGEKGNTAQGGSKRAILATGVSIQVPLFVQIGDIIRVDTRDKRYIERVKNFLNLNFSGSPQYAPSEYTTFSTIAFICSIYDVHIIKS